MARLARAVARAGITPNQVSVAGMVFGIAAGVCLAATGVLAHASAGAPADAAASAAPSLGPPSDWPLRLLFLLAAACIQLRLVCNLIDGMVAVEGGQRSAVGALYNEAPDRVSDAAGLVGAGYALSGLPWLGWLAALLAVTTAYVRMLGKAEGAGNDFRGPMAKPQRMALLTAACAALALLPTSWRQGFEGALASVVGEPAPGVMAVALALIALGSAWTCALRLRRAARVLRDQRSPAAH
jgi:phosphatidylglycerophosphate synthase